MVEEPPISRPLVPLGAAWVTNYAFYDHRVFCRGYCPAWFGVDENQRQKGPLVISLDQERPGEDASDKKVLDISRDAVDFVIPAIPQSEPLRDELVNLVRNQLQGILTSSKDASTRLEAGALVRAIDGDNVSIIPASKIIGITSTTVVVQTKGSRLGVDSHQADIAVFSFDGSEIYHVSQTRGGTVCGGMLYFYSESTNCLWRVRIDAPQSKLYLKGEAQ